MTPAETAQLLAKVQLGDNRQVDALTVREWHDTLGHLDLADAIEAVRRHRQTSLEYLMPAHVIAGARRVREQAATEARKHRQLESRRVDDELQQQPSTREHVWRAMLADPRESEATKQFIRERLGGA